MHRVDLNSNAGRTDCQPCNRKRRLSREGETGKTGPEQIKILLRHHANQRNIILAIRRESFRNRIKENSNIRLIIRYPLLYAIFFVILFANEQFKKQKDNRPYPPQIDDYSG